MTAPSNANTSGLSDACAQEEADMLASKLTNAKIIAASWKDRATAAEARADRLAKGVTSATLILTPEPGDAPLTEREKNARQYLAALQQETQP